jgi:hypothetical protein
MSLDSNLLKSKSVTHVALIEGLVNICLSLGTNSTLPVTTCGSDQMIFTQMTMIAGILTNR